MKNIINNIRKEYAFTLAEVLITLGIIGIVAAMTIPNLITSHQKKVTVTKLQKAISEINQAYRLSYNDVGEPIDEIDMGAEEYFNKYWAPYIKVATYCKNPEDCGYDSSTPFTYLNGKYNDMVISASKRRSVFYTPDGFVFIICVFHTSDDGSKIIPDPLVFVDINGGTKPNKFGKDVFVLNRNADGGGVQPNSYDRDTKDVSDNCSKVSVGWSCAEKIRRAGWQIDKTYPW